MQNVVSEHRYPRPLVRRLVSRLLAVTIALAVVSIAEVILALFVSPLLCGIAFFTAILVIPLLQRSVLHPEITVTDDGLYVQPMIWRAQLVPWDCVAEIVAHPLVYNDEAMGRVLHGKRYVPRQAVVVIVKSDAGVWLIYRLIGALAGAGNRPGFALSSTTHTSYDALIQTIRGRLS
jgi:hypothetical protein